MIVEPALVIEPVREPLFFEGHDFAASKFTQPLTGRIKRLYSAIDQGGSKDDGIDRLSNHVD